MSSPPGAPAGISSLMTRAPMSANSRTAVGPARTRVASRMVKRDRAPWRMGISWPSGRREHRHRVAAVTGFENNLDALADGERLRIAVDQVGHQRHAFVERHEGEGVGGLALAHRAE